MTRTWGPSAPTFHHPPRRRFLSATLIICAAAAFVLATISGAPVPPRWLVKWRVGNERFRCHITRPVDVARVQAAIPIHGHAGIPFGRLKAGTSENVGHDWHMENVRLVHFILTMHDGRPSDVDNDFAYWVSTIKRIGVPQARPIFIRRVD